MTASNRFRGTALLWIFVASGFAGLIYESIWTQYLGLILGHSAYAQVLVLALFMGGMALGAWIVSKRSELLTRPLLVYALVELALGLFGIGFHPYYQAVSGWSYASLFPSLSPGPALEVARWSIASLLILPQCVLLGATFPLMSAGFIRLLPGSNGKALAGLYFSNSLGAAAGALTSTFVLLPAVGLPGTVLTAGIVNVLVAISVWPLAKIGQPSTAASQRAEIASGPGKSAPAFILAAAAITGASSFVYEVSWVRMLSMVLGSTIHAFELMLAAFIAGIAFGGLWLRKRADSLRSPRHAAGWAQIAMGCMALSTLFLYNDSFSWVAWSMQTLNRSAESAYTVYNIASALIAIIVMFPTAFFAGMTLPLLTLTLIREGAGESAIGRTYAANTLGAIVGVVLAVFLVLPFVGLRVALWLAAATDILLGAILLVSFRTIVGTGLLRASWQVKAGICTGMALLVASISLTHFEPLLMSSGVFRFGTLPVADSALRTHYHRDGRTASVTLRDIGDDRRAIFTNGKPDASVGLGSVSAPDEITMMVAGVIPMLHRQQPASVAIIGFGSGMTTHFVLGNPDVEVVDTIEIEPAMVEAAQHFRPIVERAYSDPRSHIIIDDAKSYFATNGKRYDIIISEPSNPWVNGVASLFTSEFYKFVPRHLNEGGIFAQWVQGYELSPELMNTILRAMLPHFADVRLFAAGATDWLFVASSDRRFPPLGQLTIPGNWPPKIRSEMAQRGISSDQDLRLLFHGGNDVLAKYSALYPEGGINSDYFPLLQLRAPAARFRNQLAIEPAELRLADWPIFEVLSGVSPEPIGTLTKSSLVDRSPLANAIQKAQSIHGVLTGRMQASAISHVSLPRKVMVEFLGSSKNSCPPESVGDDILGLLTGLAADTIPFLPPPAGRELWSRPQWGRCPVRDILIQDVLGFIDAMAARDHHRVLAVGYRMLNRDDHLTRLTAAKPAFHYVIGGMQFAAFASGNFAEVISLEDRFGRLLAKDFPRRFLVKAALDARIAPERRPIQTN